MSPGLPARVAVVCTLIFGVSIAHAQRRPVAVIDLAGDEATEKLAKDLDGELRIHAELMPVTDPSIPPALYGAFSDPDLDNLDEARRLKARGEDSLAAYRFDAAAESFRDAQRWVREVTPTPAAIRLYAQLAFALGQAYLGLRDPPEAATHFALAHRLDPSFVPDAARYLPEVVEAFEAAKRKVDGIGTIKVTGTGRTWIDGKDAGVSPGSFEVASGRHVIWLTGDERVTRGGEVVVQPRKTAPIEIPNVPASEALKVSRARSALRAAYPDPTARAAAMKRLAALVTVTDAVLLTMSNNKIILQTWRGDASIPDRAPGFSALREVKQEAPAELLRPLGTPKKITPPDVIIGPIGPIKPIEQPRWWQKRSYQVGIGAGVVAFVVGSVLLVRAITDDTIGLNGLSSEPEELGRR